MNAAVRKMHLYRFIRCGHTNINVVTIQILQDLIRILVKCCIMNEIMRFIKNTIVGIIKNISKDVLIN